VMVAALFSNFCGAFATQYICAAPRRFTKRHCDRDQHETCFAIPLTDHMIWCAVDQAINRSKRLRIMFAVAPQMKRSSWGIA
jgi:hypothetical protein